MARALPSFPQSRQRHTYHTKSDRNFPSERRPRSRAEGNRERRGKKRDDQPRRSQERRLDFRGAHCAPRFRVYVGESRTTRVMVTRLLLLSRSFIVEAQRLYDLKPLELRMAKKQRLPLACALVRGAEFF